MKILSGIFKFLFLVAIGLSIYVVATFIANDYTLVNIDASETRWFTFGYWTGWLVCVVVGLFYQGKDT